MMNQQLINQTEWENDNNWTDGAKSVAMYFSKKDSRVWVSKRISWMGWTLNMARRESIWWIIFLTLFITLFPAIMIFMMIE